MSKQVIGEQLHPGTNYPQLHFVLVTLHMRYAERAKENSVKPLVVHD